MVKGTIVIPSWNGASILSQSLPYLGRLQGGPWEILVIDHGRLNRDTESLVKSFSFVRYVGLDEQLGFTGAVNRGVELASSDIVAVMCNDLMVDPEWMQALWEKAQRETSVPTVWFSKVRREPQPLQPQAKINFWMRVVNSPEISNQFLVPDGSSFCIRKSLTGQPFLKEYFLYQEDVFLGWSTLLRGGRVLRVEESTALNFDGGTTKRTKAITSYFTERNRWLNYLYFLSLESFIKASPSLGADFALRLAGGQNRWAKIKAIGWILLHLPEILQKRREIQSLRKVEDEKLLPLLSGTYDSHKNSLNKIFRTINGLVNLRLGA